MQEINLDAWEVFQERLAQIRCNEVMAGRRANFLFRGQGDSGWPLATTLERCGCKGMPISDYYRLINRVKPQIETFTGAKWTIRDFSNVEELLSEYDALALRKFPSPGEYSYMMHLRHHGFPSPLLDWSRSPYVAAYFAFRSASEPSARTVSMYLYSDSPEGYRADSSAEPWIRRTGPYVSTHRRHFLQQSDYTLCVNFHENAWYFAGHTDVFGRGDTHQDLLWKFNIPWAERLKVLKLLDDYNLNALSLFDSEEALMETMALRELEFKKGDP